MMYCLKKTIFYKNKLFLKEMFYRVVVMFMICMEVCWGTDPPKSYGPPSNNYQNIYDTEFQRPLAVFTEIPINVADYALVPVVQVPSSDLRVVYRPQIDSISKTEPIVMCKSSTKSFVSICCTSSDINNMGNMLLIYFMIININLNK